MLTRFREKTLLRKEFLNKLFGGLWGATDVSEDSEYDPDFYGHKHDGQHQDGHAQKINLVTDVNGKLRGSNIDSDTISKENISSSFTQSEGIPEYQLIDGERKYFLDLSYVYDAIDSAGDSLFIQVEDGYAGTLITQRSDDFSLYGPSFVWGSSSTENLNEGILGDNRFYYSKSSGAFRAGSVDHDQWDSNNVGNYSAAFNRNNTAIGESSTVFGIDNKTRTTAIASIASGKDAVATVIGEKVHGAGKFTSAGDCQYSELILKLDSTTATFDYTNLTISALDSAYRLDDDTTYFIEAVVFCTEKESSITSGYPSMASFQIRCHAAGEDSTYSSPAAIVEISNSVLYSDSSLDRASIRVTLEDTNKLRLQARVQTSSGSGDPGETRWLAKMNILKIGKL